MTRRNLTIVAAIFLPLMVTSFQNCAVDNQIQDTKAAGSASNSSNQGTTPSPSPIVSPALTPPAVYTACSVFLTSGKTWVVPSDWNSGSNSIEAIGNGSDSGGNVRGGGGGGAYSKSVNVVLTPRTTVAYNLAHVGISLGAGNSSGDVWFCNSTSGCASLVDSSVVVSAQGGKGSTNGINLDSMGGLGGSAMFGIAIGPGAVRYSGGNGGPCGGTTPDGCNGYPGGGGGAAGPNGNGANGTDVGGAGNGGAAPGGAGGVFPNQAPGIAGAVAYPFGNTSYGIGGGGGGGGYLSTGGAGGMYGGGAGGGGYSYYQNTIGGNGLIVIKYQGTTCK